MADKHSIEERIAHFLRLAEDIGATQAERDLASAQAERLMIKHGIESIDLTTGLPRAEEIVRRTLFFAGSYADARSDIAFQVIGALKLRGYIQHLDAQQARYHARVMDWDAATPRMRDQSSLYVDHASGKRAAGNLFTLVGYESDARDARSLIASLDVQGAVALKDWWRHEGKYTTLRTPHRSWYSSMVIPSEAQQQQNLRIGFLQGFGVGAAKRITEMRFDLVREAEATNPGTAVALINKEQAVKDWLESTTSLKQGRSRQNHANSAGIAAGRNANVGGHGIGAGQRALAR